MSKFTTCRLGVLYSCRMDAKHLRVTMVIMDVLGVLMNAPPDDPVWGLRLCEQTGYGTGTIYPALDRLLNVGWIEDKWEEPPPKDRPSRRFYFVTSAGRVAYQQVCSERARRRKAWEKPALNAEGMA